jgi:hypothetical protein
MPKTQNSSRTIPFKAIRARAEKTSLPYAHLSRICALSIGEDHQP